MRPIKVKAKGKVSEILSNISPIKKREVHDRIMMSTRINKALKESGFSAKQLAEMTGKTEADVEGWLSGHEDINLSTLSLIGDALKCDLLSNEDTRPNYFVPIGTVRVSEKAFYDNSTLSYEY